jgi:hypothetical protein
MTDRTDAPAEESGLPGPSREPLAAAVEGVGR